MINSNHTQDMHGDESEICNYTPYFFVLTPPFQCSSNMGVVISTNFLACYNNYGTSVVHVTGYNIIMAEQAQLASRTTLTDCNFDGTCIMPRGHKPS